MIKTGPSGALSPYYYKGGYFHAIHYGSYFDDTAALISMMNEEEAFIMRSAERRRIMIDLYENNMDAVLAEFTAHIERLNTAGKIVRLAVSAEKNTLKIIRRALFKGCSLPRGCMYFSPDMEEAKTWLVSDH